ncbi:MAG: formylmethanofuran dehydrogenase subunit C [Candidatus Lokiarchaeota archaeon]|nr:formylmethanofuran dehydrogenase subunit C [Candidatus Lokiarchaeota archaeon]
MVETITFKLKKTTDLPLEVEAICPDKLAGKKTDEIKKMLAYEGKATHELGAIFDISGKPGDKPAETKIVVQGSTMKLRRIGESMTAGEVEIHGDAGMHVGDMMKGGKIVVHGNADHYAASMMEGGELWIEGNAGDYLGAAYRGEWRGMKGGKIFVDGNAGFEIGAWMRGTKASQDKGEPLIHVKGNVQLHPGHHNHGGFMIIEGDAEGNVGSEMARGDIIVLGKTEPLACFSKDVAEVAELAALKIKGPFIAYTGDNGIGGKGKLYLKAPGAKAIVIDRKLLCAIVPPPAEAKPAAIARAKPAMAADVKPAAKPAPIPSLAEKVPPEKKGGKK